MKKTILMLMIAVIACSCNKARENDTKFEPITKATTDVCCEWGSEDLIGQWINADEAKSNKVFIVNSQSEMDNFIAEDAVNVPQIDFKNKTLLLVWGRTTSGIQNLTKEFKQTELKEFALNVDITIKATSVCEKWIVVLTTSKLAVDSVTLSKTIH